MRQFLIGILLLALLPISIYPAKKSSQRLYVFSKKAVVYEEAITKSKAVTTLKRGDAVVKLGKKGMWYRIRVGKKTGWISKYLVSAHHPNKKTKKINLKKINLKKNARKRASAYSTAASARALSTKKGVTANLKADMKAVQDMEAQKISPKAVKDFIKDGRLDSE